jgi:protein involved in polysaccharide export with SLBB domain
MRLASFHLLVSAFSTTALLALSPAPAVPQQPDPAAHRLQATRAELEAVLERLRGRGQASDSAFVQGRLDAGDFHVGDRVLLAVEDPPLPTTADRLPPLKTQEQQLSDTFTVGAGTEILLPIVGTVSLRGVLRSELEGVMTNAVSRYIRDPVVHARPLISVGVTGEVGKPGYYGVPADAVVSALLNAAGGPTKDAKMNKLKLERDGRSLLSGGSLRQAMAQGRTLDELQLRSGDQLIVPSKNHSDIYDPIRLVAVLLSIPVTVYTLTHLR